MRIKQAIILAGGKGTRLATVLNGLPKPLVIINGIPLLQRQIEQLIKSGFSHIVLLVNHKRECIDKFLSVHNNFGIDITVIDDGEPKGTAGALIGAYAALDEEFLVVYGDTLFDIDINKFAAFHEIHNGDVTLLVHPNDHPHDSDLIEIGNNNKIIAFYSYPHPENLLIENIVNAAMYFIKRDCLSKFTGKTIKPMDLAKTFFPLLIKAGNTLIAYNTPEYIKDIGTPDRLKRTEQHLIEGHVANKSFKIKQKAVFIDRDGTLNIANGHIKHHSDFNPYPRIGVGMKRLQVHNYRTIMITNQPVIARGEATISDLKKIHAKLDLELAKNQSYFDAKYICTHHPDSGFEGEIQSLKFDCECRKPKPGMIFNAQKDLNINLSKSWLIGDSSLDFGAAKNAGVTSIGVKTGSASRDKRTPYIADIILSDFGTASYFITKQYPTIEHSILSQLKTLPTHDFIILSNIGDILFDIVKIILNRSTHYLQYHSLEKLYEAISFQNIPEKLLIDSSIIFSTLDHNSINKTQDNLRGLIISPCGIFNENATEKTSINITYNLSVPSKSNE